MIYTIEETNLDRQHLLSQVLNPNTAKALAQIRLPQNAKILDIGCGLGDTSLLLNKTFPGSKITGLDGDSFLIQAAIEEKTQLHPNMNFVCADALLLPFEDNHFDFVFTRFCLHHLSDALAALNEMKRVCKEGGIVFAQEPDGNSLISYPENAVYPKLKGFINELFADVLLGRKLISYFKKLGLRNISFDVQSVLGDENSPLKSFYATSAVSLRKSLLKRNLIDESEFDELIAELKKCEKDDDTIVLMHPNISVWSTKPKPYSSN